MERKKEKTMDRRQAREIAESITFEEIQSMLKTAKEKIVDWKKRSIVNKSFDKGMAWNILAKPELVEALKNKTMKRTEILYKTNLVREFGDYLPDHLKPAKKSKKELPEPRHQEPIFY